MLPDINQANNVLRSITSSEKLCLVTENGHQFLDKITKEETRSLANRIGKYIGLGPLAGKDTSVESVEKYLVKLFDESKGSLLIVARNKNAHDITKKIADIAARNGLEDLSKILEVADTYVGLSKAEQVQTSLEDLLSVLTDKSIRGYPIRDRDHLKEVAGLLKTQKQLKEQIKNKRAEPITPNYFEEYSNLRNSLTDNKRRLMVSCYGSEAARKLPFEEVKLFFNHDQTRALASKVGPGSNLSKEELSAKVKVLKDQEIATERRIRLEGVSKQEVDLLENYGFSSKIETAPSNELKKIVNLLVDYDNLNDSIKELIEEKNSLEEDEVFFKNSELENARKSRDIIEGQLIQMQYDLSDDVMKNVPLEDLKLILRYELEITLNSESTAEELQEIAKTLKEEKEKYEALQQEKSNNVIEQPLFEGLASDDAFGKGSPELSERLKPLLPDEETQQKVLSDKVEQAKVTAEELEPWEEFNIEVPPVYTEKELEELFSFDLPKKESPAEELIAVKKSIDNLENEIFIHDTKDNEFFDKAGKDIITFRNRKKELEEEIEKGRKDNKI